LNAYLDSSFVVSLYLTDIHSIEARQRITAGGSFQLTPLHLAEWAHALAQQQFWGNLTQQKGREMNLLFVADQRAGLWQTMSLPDNAFQTCADLAKRYGPSIGLRTLDSLHVACAIELRAERFWTFDERQAKLAKAQGLKTL
jgi:predicted nucleic acid-binding protein